MTRITILDRMRIRKELIELETLVGSSERDEAAVERRLEQARSALQGLMDRHPDEPELAGFLAAINKLSIQPTGTFE